METNKWAILKDNEVIMITEFNITTAEASDILPESYDSMQKIYDWTGTPVIGMRWNKETDKFE